MNFPFCQSSVKMFQRTRSLAPSSMPSSPYGVRNLRRTCFDASKSLGTIYRSVSTSTTSTTISSRTGCFPSLMSQIICYTKGFQNRWYTCANLMQSAERRKRRKAIRRLAMKLKNQDEIRGATGAAKNGVRKKRRGNGKKWPKMTKLPVSPQNLVPKHVDPPPDLKPLLPNIITSGSGGGGSNISNRVTSKATAAAAAATTSDTSVISLSQLQRKTMNKLIQWIKDNAGVLILNFGSICSFLSFTRQDIIELRVLNMTGSVCAVIYFLTRTPKVIAPVVWSSIFATTNLYMIYLIYEERKGKPKLDLSHEEEAVYMEHFWPYGVTPRMFEKLLHISKKRKLNKGDTLVRKGQKADHVYLVASGGTEAVCSTLNRSVTVAGSKQGNKEKLVGGDAGAWIGELAFFDHLSEQSRKNGTAKPISSFTKTNGNDDSKTNFDNNAIKREEITERSSLPDGFVSHRNSIMPKDFILTYKATKDSTLVFEWNFDELIKLMQSSADLRTSVSRAMTAAVIGKVVNFYIPKATTHAITAGSHDGEYESNNRLGWKGWLESLHLNPALLFSKDHNHISHHDHEDSDSDDDERNKLLHSQLQS